MPESSSPRWEGAAFGLSLRSEFELPGLKRDAEPPETRAARSVSIERGQVPPPAAGDERLQEWNHPDGSLSVAIDRHPEDGYRIDLDGVGVFSLTLDGSRAICKPDSPAGWQWKRYLIGGILPFSAVLQGLEVFHASAVAFDGRAIALAGGSGVGKSTLALNMHIAGADFVADDSIAVEDAKEALLVHPASATAKARRQALDLLAADEAQRLHEVVSEDEHETRFLVEPVAQPLPFGGICILEPADEPGSLEVGESRLQPWELLGSTFNTWIRDPVRLRTQLDLCGRIADSVPALRVRVGPRPGPEAAAVLLDRLRQGL
jgi:hypothetical protein